jgi:hypothetical protein
LATGGFVPLWQQQNIRKWKPRFARGAVFTFADARAAWPKTRIDITDCVNNLRRGVA